MTIDRIKDGDIEDIPVTAQKLRELANAIEMQDNVRAYLKGRKTIPPFVVQNHGENCIVGAEETCKVIQQIMRDKWPEFRREIFEFLQKKVDNAAWSTGTKLRDPLKGKEE